MQIKIWASRVWVFLEILTWTLRSSAYFEVRSVYLSTTFFLNSWKYFVWRILLHHIFSRDYADMDREWIRPVEISIYLLKTWNCITFWREFEDVTKKIGIKVSWKQVKINLRYRHFELIYRKINCYKDREFRSEMWEILGMF